MGHEHDHNKHCGERDHCHEHSHGHSRSGKDSPGSGYMIKGLGILFFAAAFFIKSYSLYLFLAAYLFIGHEVIFDAISSIFSKDFFNENFLMFIASIGSFIIGNYPEAVAVMFFYSVGEFFQDKAVEASEKRIRKITSMRQESVTVLTDEGEKQMPHSELKPGDIVILKAGETVPADATVISGNGLIDESPLTGESLPVNVGENSPLLSGSISCGSTIKIKIEKEYSSSTAAKILDLIENAPEKKAMTENFVRKFSKIYTPVVMCLALLIAVIPPFFVGFESFSDWVYRGLVFLTISCPCALVLSVPLSYYSAIGLCSKNGILIKGSCFLDALGKVSEIFFDKTGTLTCGKFSVKSVKPQNGFDEETVKKLAVYSEALSNHPLAEAIRASFVIKADPSLLEEYTEKAGMGAESVYEGKRLLAGNRAFMEYYGIETVPSEENTVIYIAYGDSLAGIIEFSDVIRNDAAETVKKLKRKGIRCTMLTGDNKKAAEATAEAVGIKSFRYGLLPHQKVESISEAKEARKGNIVFVGDGINDAPSLKNADIGVSMGGIGSDSAVEASDIVLMSDRLSLILKGMRISAKTKRIITQNIIFILAVKLIVMYYAAWDMAPMWLAVAADVGCALLAIANTLRLSVGKGKSNGNN